MKNVMLIVDDSELNRELFSLQFREQFEIVEATTGRQALKILENCNGNVDIILLDLMMPEMDGMTLLGIRMKTEYLRKIPVVVITASNAVDDQVGAFNLGANDFINTPFNAKIVKSRIHNVLLATQRIEYLQQETEILRMRAEEDAMTGLFNKTTTEGMIDDILRHENKRTHALLVVDIDNFKAVNDTYGHLEGDRTIKIIANAISGIFRRTDIIGRVGGDEFAVLMTNVPSVDIVRNKVGELLQLMKGKPNLTIPANVTLSIGYALSEEDVQDYNALFRRADHALYQAKQGGKARGQQYGAPTASAHADACQTVLYYGRSHSASALIEAQLADGYCLAEAFTPGQAAEAIREKHPVLLYADVSDLGENDAAFWQELRGMVQDDSMPIIAICSEGNLAQYRQAMDAGVCDLLVTPLEITSLKRRTENQLNKYVKLRENV